MTVIRLRWNRRLTLKTDSFDCEWINYLLDAFTWESMLQTLICSLSHPSVLHRQLFHNQVTSPNRWVFSLWFRRTRRRYAKFCGDSNSIVAVLLAIQAPSSEVLFLAKMCDVTSTYQVQYKIQLLEDSKHLSALLLQFHTLSFNKNWLFCSPVLEKLICPASNKIHYSCDSVDWNFQLFVYLILCFRLIAFNIRAAMVKALCVRLLGPLSSH